MSKQNIIVAVIIVLMVVFLIIYQNPPAILSDIKLPQEIEAQLIVEDQAPASFVVVKSAIFPAGGFVVIRNDLLGEFGDIIGQSDYFPAGYETSVTAILDRDSQIGQSLYAVLYQDDGDRIFDSTKDQPYEQNINQPVSTKFLILDRVLLNAN